MEEVFIKKYWPEENTLFYMHFRNGVAIRQIEISTARKIFLSTGNPVEGESSLFDQPLTELEIDRRDFITQAAFDSEWEKHKEKS